MDKNQLINEILKERNYSNLNFSESIKDSLIFPSINFLNEKLKEHSEFNFKKILLIALILVNKLKKYQRVPVIVIVRLLRLRSGQVRSL